MHVDVVIFLSDSLFLHSFANGIVFSKFGVVVLHQKVRCEFVTSCICNDMLSEVRSLLPILFASTLTSLFPSMHNECEYFAGTCKSSFLDFEI
jgi:hypothetical protein